MADGGAIEVGGALALYDAMCTAIAECVRVDEAKDIRDKAVALEAYYKQARNLDAEREAANVRLRAERRVGELLEELDRAQGQRTDLMRDTLSNDATKSPYAETLERQGISRQTAQRYRELAKVPAETFERALSAPSKPSTAGVLREHDARAQMRNPPPKATVSDDAMALWGTLRDFERLGLLNADPGRLLSQMTDAMRADVRRIIPHVCNLLAHLEQSFEPA